MVDYVYDIECYPNFFSCVIIDVDSRKYWAFEVSERVDQSKEFITMLVFIQSTNGRMFGFNSVSYDWWMCQYLMDVFDHKCFFTAAEAYARNQIYYAIPWNEKYKHTIWENKRRIVQGDLFLIHHFDNTQKLTSLKVWASRMRSANIKDLPYPPGTWLTPDQMGVTLAYNVNDSKETLDGYWWSKGAIDFRDELKVSYPDLGDVLNFNDTKIGKKFFEMKLKEQGVAIKRGGTPRPTINLGSVVSPKVSFQAPSFQNVIAQLNATTVTKTKESLKGLTATVGGFQFDFGTGGLHASLKKVSVFADDQHDIIDVDVVSFYPNLAISNRLYPEHLTDRFCDINSMLFEMRKQYSKAQVENGMIKLGLNGTYGDSGNPHSIFFDPRYMMSITINGQMMLCMLAEWCMSQGAQMIQANTDGITFKVRKDQRPYIMDVCKQWEARTGLELEYTDYTAMHIRDVNSYLAVKTDGSVKRIGAYAYETPMDKASTREKPWHKSHDMLAVAKAAEAKILHGVDPYVTLTQNTDPFDFCKMVKVQKTGRLEIHRRGGAVEPIQNTSRYYISTAGDPFVKVLPPLPKKPGIERPSGVEKGFWCKAANDITDFNHADVNWHYYIEEVNKLTALGRAL